MANFHVDSSGNLWIGTNSSNTFSTAQSANVPFSVTSAGAIEAISGTIGGINLSASSIESSNYNASSGSEAGFKIESDGDAFFNSISVVNPIIVVGKDTGNDVPTTAATDRIKIGDSVLFSRDFAGINHLFSTKAFCVMADGTEDNPSLTIQGDYQKMGFFLSTNTDFNFDIFKGSNGDDDIWSYTSNSTDFTILGHLLLSAGLKAGGSTGSSGEVLQSTGNGVQWASAGGSHADGDHTSFAASGHNHNSSYDNYDHWDVNGMQMDSGFGLTVQAGTGISVSNSSSPHTITISNTATGLSSAVQGINGNTSSQHYFSTSGTGFFSNSDMDGSNSTHSFAFSSTMPNAASITTGHVLPNGTKNIGGFGTYWDYVYYNNLSGSSDERKKNSIEDIDVGLDFINTLKPRKFKWNIDENIECNTCGQSLETVGDDCTADDCEGEAFDSNLDRADDLQYGFIAQETIPLMPDSEQDYGLVNYKDDADEYVMSYTSMVAPLVKAVQELSTQITDLTARVEALEG